MSDPAAPGEPAESSEARLRERLRERGLRFTGQRASVLRAVDVLGHATPDEVHEEVGRRGEPVNLSTVYRTLDVLEEVGLVRHAHLSDRAPTYHSTVGHEHFHLVCRGCGSVTSKSSDSLEPVALSWRAEDGFVADVGHLTVFGTCRACASA